MGNSKETSKSDPILELRTFDVPVLVAVDLTANVDSKKKSKKKYSFVNTSFFLFLHFFYI